MGDHENEQDEETQLVQEAGFEHAMIIEIAVTADKYVKELRRRLYEQIASGRWLLVPFVTIENDGSITKEYCKDAREYLDRVIIQTKMNSAYASNLRQMILQLMPKVPEQLVGTILDLDVSKQGMLVARANKIIQLAGPEQSDRLNVAIQQAATLSRRDLQEAYNVPLTKVVKDEDGNDVEVVAETSNKVDAKLAYTGDAGVFLVKCASTRDIYNITAALVKLGVEIQTVTLGMIAEEVQ